MNEKNYIAVGSDHAGFKYKQKLIEHLKASGYEVADVGCNSTESCHYPVFAHKLCELVQSGECRCGILICGTGIGMSMVANKHRGIRAAVCTDEYSAELTRQHNDANVLCMGARVIDYDKAQKLADIFLDTEFIGGKHAQRIAMFTDIENGCFKS